MSYTHKLSIVSIFVALALPLVANAKISELETVLAEEQEVTDYHQLDAQIEAVNKSTVSVQTGGVISKLTYDVGDYVKKGSLIARISFENQKSGLQVAKASVIIQLITKIYYRLKYMVSRLINTFYHHLMTHIFTI